MKPEVLEALKKSIKHWEQLRDGESKDVIGPHSCALCQMFWKPTQGSTIKVKCDGCPVDARSGIAGCIDTPYDLMADSDWQERYNCESDWQQTEEFKNMAALELKFLVSLLPFEEWLAYQYASMPSPIKPLNTDDYDKLQTQPMIDFNE